jgi:hypothetical protein
VPGSSHNCCSAQLCLAAVTTAAVLNCAWQQSQLLQCSAVPGSSHNCCSAQLCLAAAAACSTAGAGAHRCCSLRALLQCFVLQMLLGTSGQLPAGLSIHRCAVKQRLPLRKSNASNMCIGTCYSPPPHHVIHLPPTFTQAAAGLLLHPPAGTMCHWARSITANSCAALLLTQPPPLARAPAGLLLLLPGTIYH